MPIPEAFIIEMKKLWNDNELPGAFCEFMGSLNQPQVRGIRANGLKISPFELSELMDNVILHDENNDNQAWMVPWNDDGFYIQADSAVGKMPAYHAGLFYIQEPSAMLPAKVLAAQPGEKILDLCAAPGGKTARIAADLYGRGLLWSNEISADRARALLRNIELMGCKNCVISQETPERLAEALGGFFDRILVDAPCSGSGMFRRDNQAASSWEKYGVEHCTTLQRDILISANKMLKPGGYIVYSTCSFSLAENEGMIKNFIDNHPFYSLIEIKGPGLSPGIKYDGDDRLLKTARIWPHITNGDGHYCALLQKNAQSTEANSGFADDRSVSSYSDFTSGNLGESAAAIDEWQQWAENVLSNKGFLEMRELIDHWIPRLHNGHLQLLPPEIPAFANIKMIKTGFYLGHYKISGKPVDTAHRSAAKHKLKQRVIFEPAHSWFTAMHADDFAYTLRLESADTSLLRYLRGETISLDNNDIIVRSDRSVQSGDIIVICLNDYPLGYGKMQQGTLKNMYPAAWRLRS